MPDEAQPQEITDDILSVLDDAVGKMSKMKKTATGPKPQLRFAEDLAQFAPRAGESPKAKKKKKSSRRAFMEDETATEYGADLGDDMAMGDKEDEA